MSPNKIKKVLEDLLEIFSAIEHERWSKWQRYMHSKGRRQDDGSILIPAEYIQRWERQMSTAYNDLPELEKESDRDQVREYQEIIADAITKRL